MATSVRPFLMFDGKSEEAMNLYVSLFPGSAIASLTRYGPGQSGPEGSVMVATFTIAGQEVMCSDSSVKHGVFTLASSLFVQCESDEEIERLAAALAESGGVRLPLADWGFSRRFAWVTDRFGVSWQLNLP